MTGIWGHATGIVIVVLMLASVALTAWGKRKQASREAQEIAAMEQLAQEDTRAKSVGTDRTA